MPSSNLWLAPKVLHYIADAKPRRVLDVGPGNGKYGVLMREYVPSLEHLAAVEAEARYVRSFPWLSAIYDELIVADVLSLDDDYLATFDLVLMADVLEHLDQDLAGELLRAIPGRIIVVTPRDYFQNPEALHGWPTENHRSHWSAASIAEAAGRPLDREDVDALDAFGGVLVRVSAK
jgi:SAM-dependent methyltransferase